MRYILCFFYLLFISACSSVDVVLPIEGSEIEVSVIDLKQETKVYTLALYSTVSDLLVLIDCDECDLTRFNPNAPLHPNDVIVLYPKKNDCISINQADLITLDQLSGIGPSLSQRIIDYRQNVGYFQSLEEIMLVKGIKEKLFEKIKAFICL